MKHKKSIFFPTFIVIFIVGYAFFLTSKLWYPNGDDLVTATKLNTEKFFNGRTVKVMRWDYSKSQGLCEVELDISNQQYDGIDTYDYEAILPSGKELDIKNIIEKPDFVVLHITVPKNWQEISLRLRLPEKARTSDSTTLKLYGTIQSVQNVSNIKEMSFLDYQIRRLDDSIQFYNKEIGKNAKSIATLTEKYNHMSTTIADLNSQKQYMTEEEISDTDQTIASTQSDQKEIQNQIDALKADNLCLRKSYPLDHASIITASGTRSSFIAKIQMPAMSSPLQPGNAWARTYRKEPKLCKCLYL